MSEIIVDFDSIEDSNDHMTWISEQLAHGDFVIRYRRGEQTKPERPAIKLGFFAALYEAYKASEAVDNFDLLSEDRSSMEKFDQLQRVQIDAIAALRQCLSPPVAEGKLDDSDIARTERAERLHRYARTEVGAKPLTMIVWSRAEIEKIVADAFVIYEAQRSGRNAAEAVALALDQVRATLDYSETQAIEIEVKP